MLKLENKYFLSGLFVIILLPFFIFFGITGIRFIVGFVLMITPIVLFLNLFDLELDEKLIIGTFISIPFFPLIVWYFNWVISSLRITIVITFLILTSLALTLNKLFKKENI